MITSNPVSNEGAEGIWQVWLLGTRKVACLCLPSLRRSDTIEIGPKPSTVKEVGQWAASLYCNHIHERRPTRGPSVVGEARQAGNREQMEGRCELNDPVGISVPWDSSTYGTYLLTCYLPTLVMQLCVSAWFVRVDSRKLIRFRGGSMNRRAERRRGPLSWEGLERRSPSDQRSGLRRAISPACCTMSLA